MNKLTNEFLDKHNPERFLRASIPGWDELSPKDKAEASEAYSRKNRLKLVQEYNVDSDSDLTDNMRYGDGSEKETK